MNLALAVIVGGVGAGSRILPDIRAFLTVAICIALLAAVVLGGWMAHLFGSRIPASIGVASFTLYLLHQNIGVGLLTLMPGTTPVPLMIAGFIAILAGLIGASRLIYSFVEMPAQNLLRRRLRPDPVRIS